MTLQWMSVKALHYTPWVHSATVKQTFHVSIIRSYRRLTSECLYIKSTIYMTRYSVFLQHRCNRTPARSVKLLPFIIVHLWKSPTLQSLLWLNYITDKSKGWFFVREKNIKGLHIKVQKCSNSGLNHSSVPWGWSSTEETFSQSYDCEAEFTERRETDQRGARFNYLPLWRSEEERRGESDEN